MVPEEVWRRSTSAAGDGEQVVGIGRPEGLAVGEGDLPQVGDRLDRLGDDSLPVEDRLVIHHVAVHPVQGELEPLQLQLLQLVAGDALVFWIPDSHVSSFNLA